MHMCIRLYAIQLYTGVFTSSTRLSDDHRIPRNMKYHVGTTKFLPQKDIIARCQIIFCTKHTMLSMHPSYELRVTSSKWQKVRKKFPRKNTRKLKIMTAFLALWACLVPLFATSNECTDAFESMSGLAPATSVEIECSTERQRVHRGTMRA